MKTITTVFFVIFYFVATHIRCDIESNSMYGEERSEVAKTIFRTVNATAVPFYANISVSNGVDLDLRDAVTDSEKKGKLCLKNVTECMEKDKDFRITTDKLLEVVLSIQPPFDLSKVKGVSVSCQRHSRRFISDLKKFKLWALKMYDSTAKLPSAILNGNVNQLGDFDMCMAANLEQEGLHGKYCLASLEVQAPQSPYLAALHRLVHSHYHFKSKLEDPGHRVPRFSSINWALCVPSSCSSTDVELGLKHAVSKIFEDTELEIRYEVDPNMCQSSVKEPIPFSTVAGVSVFAALILVELFATIYDSFAVGEKNQWIVAFSFKKNWRSISTITRSPGDIQAVHGIRMLNAILLLLAHKSMALFFVPYANRTDYVEYVGRPFTVIGRAASLYTDPFIMISGLLTAHSITGKLNRTGKINIVQEYVSRLFRIVPTFAGLIAFCTLVLPWMDSGPLWNQVVTQHSHICKRNWWRNLLFIHNYFGFKDMCLTHTHHVGIDTQLFFISPALIYTLWRWPKKGSIILLTLAAISTVARYYVTYTMELSNYIHFGTSIQQLFATADYMYILPPHRLTVYIMGVFLGYILKNYKNLTLTESQLRIGNTLALCSFLISFFGAAFMGSIDYEYKAADAAWYAAVSPILWVASFQWIIFTTHLGYTGSLGRFFSMPVWTLWTKISYTVYLTQFPIYFYNVGKTRTAGYYGFFTQMLNLQEYSWVIFLSVILSLVLELPFQNIRNIVIKDREPKNMITSEIRKKNS